MRPKTFRKGIHPPGNKGRTDSLPVEALPLPAKVVLPLSQNIGAPAKPRVSVGDQVLVGQEIAESQGMVSVPLHATISGKVTAIEPRPHPSGKMIPAIVIEDAGLDSSTKSFTTSKRPLETIPAAEIREMMRQAGLVGMGGAAFPTHVKYSPPEGKKIDLVILNGAECEPYLTCDHRLMLERTDDLIYGLQAMMRAAGAQKGYIAVEMNKPDAIRMLSTAVQGLPIEVVPLKVKYPQGEEKLVIKAVTGRIVPAGGLPVDAGVVVNNVATAAALAVYLKTGQPLISRIITVTGSGIKEPKNLEVRLGTLVEEALLYCGGFSGTPGRVIMGGPMTGPAQYRLDLPIIKGTSGILVQTAEEVSGATDRESLACIRCGKCIKACPYSLLPNFLGEFAEHGRLEAAEKYGIMDCRECGSCAYVCPSRRPLMQLIKDAKNRITAAKRNKG